jgi:hypothetical protein
MYADYYKTPPLRDGSFCSSSLIYLCDVLWQVDQDGWYLIYQHYSYHPKVKVSTKLMQPADV